MLRALLIEYTMFVVAATASRKTNNKRCRVAHIETLCFCYYNLDGTTIRKHARNATKRARAVRIQRNKMVAFTAEKSDAFEREQGLQQIASAPRIIVIQVAATPRAVDIVDSPVSTSIDQDEPSTSIPSTQEQEKSLIISQGVEESLKTPHFNYDPLQETLHEDSTSQGLLSNVRPSHTPFELLGKWTKNHPIVNMIRDPSRSVSTRKQLQTDAMWCYFDAFLTSVGPKNYKEAMLESS
ncbi:hypothetical protein Tco_1202090 [Tanacetum coccineum]